MPEDPATIPEPPEEEHLVRHRKRRRHRFRPESEALARHRQDLRALSWIMPACLLVLGAVILAVEFRNPEPAARAKDVVSIGCALVGAGAVWLSLVLAGGWIAAVRAWRRENGEEPRHSHHHHHHDR
jgi:hypothetical protein